MNDITISGSTLALFTGLLGAVAGCVSVLFKMLMAAKDKAMLDMQKINDDRYAEIRGERDFWRDRYNESEKAQTQTLLLVKDGVTVIQSMVQQLAEARHGA